MLVINFFKKRKKGQAVKNKITVIKIFKPQRRGKMKKFTQPKNNEKFKTNEDKPIENEVEEEN